MESSVDRLGTLGLYLWMGLSSWAFFEQSWDTFQRLGALGVAVAVLYFAAVKLFAAVPQPRGLPERLELMSKNTQQAQFAATNALFGVALLARELEADKEVRGRMVKAAARELGGPLDHAKPLEWPEDRDISERLERAGKAEETANDAVASTTHSSHKINAAIICLGTLQSGFGDLLRIEACPSC